MLCLIATLTCLLFIHRFEKNGNSLVQKSQREVKQTKTFVCVEDIVLILLYRESFVQRDFMICFDLFVLIVLTGEEHFFLNYLTTLFPNLVNDRVYASYLIECSFMLQIIGHI